MNFINVIIWISGTIVLDYMHLQPLKLAAAFGNCQGKCCYFFTLVAMVAKRLSTLLFTIYFLNYLKKRRQRMFSMQATLASHHSILITYSHYLLVNLKILFRFFKKNW